MRNWEEEEEVRIPRKHKNTKRWCKGVKGREHQPETHDYYEYKRWERLLNWEREQGPEYVTKIIVCKACGKELDSIRGKRDYDNDERRGGAGVAGVYERKGVQ